MNIRAKKFWPQAPRAEGIVGHGQQLAAHRIVLPLDRDVGDFALLVVFQDREQILVATIDVVAQLQLAGSSTNAV